MGRDIQDPSVKFLWGSMRSLKKELDAEVGEKCRRRMNKIWDLYLIGCHYRGGAPLRRKDKRNGRTRMTPLVTTLHQEKGAKVFSEKGRRVS